MIPYLRGLFHAYATTCIQILLRVHQENNGSWIQESEQRDNENRRRRSRNRIQEKMRRLKEKQQSTFNAEKLEINTVPPKGLALHVHLLVVLMGVIAVANGKLLSDSDSDSDTPLAGNASNATALYVLGDSSVDCGDNTLFYPLLHHNLSLYPCNGSHTSLLPHLLGTTFSFHVQLGTSAAFWMVWDFSWFVVLIKYQNIPTHIVKSNFHAFQYFLQDEFYSSSFFLFLNLLIFFTVDVLQFIVNNHEKRLSNW